MTGYVSKHGLARLCTEDYDTSSQNVFSHLTNYSLNKNSDKFNHGHDEETKGDAGEAGDAEVHSKITIDEAFQRMVESDPNIEPDTDLWD